MKETIIGIAALVTSLGTLIGVVIAVRNAINKVFEGQKCLLRSHIVSVYYHYKESEKIPQYEKENVLLLYEAYTQLNGNSFIHDLVENEIRSWEVTR